MGRGRSRKPKRAAPQGAWLAFLALAVQLFLPFLLAYEIVLASDPAYAETTTVCLAGGWTDAGAQQGGQAGHHGLADGCPICTALAAGHAFTPAVPIALPLPRTTEIADFRAAATRRLCAVAAASYSSRAPPSQA